MPHILAAPWPIGTTVELYRRLSGSGEPAGAPLTTAVVAAGTGVGGASSSEVTFTGTVESGPCVATAVVASKRTSVQCFLGV